MRTVAGAVATMWPRFVYPLASNRGSIPSFQSGGRINAYISIDMTIYGQIYALSYVVIPVMIGIVPKLAAKNARNYWHFRLCFKEMEQNT